MQWSYIRHQQSSKTHPVVVISTFHCIAVFLLVLLLKNLEFLLESVDLGVPSLPNQLSHWTYSRSVVWNFRAATGTLLPHVIRRFYHGSIQHHSIIIDKSEFSRKGAWKWIFLSFNTLFASEYSLLCFRTSWSKFTAFPSNWNRRFCQVVFSISSFILWLVLLDTMDLGDASKGGCPPLHNVPFPPPVEPPNRSSATAPQKRPLIALSCWVLSLLNSVSSFNIRSKFTMSMLSVSGPGRVRLASLHPPVLQC